MTRAEAARTGLPHHDGRPLNILIVADDLYPGFGGQAASTEGFVRVLLERGHRVEALAADVDKPTEPPEVIVHRLPSWRPGDKMTRFVLPFYTHLRELVERADIVHVMMPSPVCWRALAHAQAAGKPGIVGLHVQRESLTHHVNPLFRNVVGDALDTYYRTFFRMADVAVVPSHFAASVFAEYSPRPCEVVSNGVDRGVYAPDRVDHAAARSFRERLGVPDGGYLVLSVGRLSHEKDPLALLRVGAELARERQDFVLAFGGSGPLADTMRAEIERLGLHDRVKLLGFVPDADLPTAYAAADIFALGSPTELQGIVLLEAMALGAALFVAEVPTSAASEALAGGRTGESFDPADPAGSARRLAALLDDRPRLAAMRRAALEEADGHDLRRSVSKLESIYRRAVAGEYRTGTRAAGKDWQ
ncbi:MAG TPA: glycosyltransferase [Candidatus Thermoplasmatota archaeon]|nr:glycosyltransferase [Candidatus Thermoplasmatota archaeon]